MVVYEVLHPFPLSTALGTLVGGLGCFPLDYGSYHSQSDSQGLNYSHSYSIGDLSRRSGLFPS